jgi:hypothetical protein
MFGKGRGWLMAWVFAVGLLTPTRLLAGPLTGLGSSKKAGCPPPSYSPLHYWTPAAYRLDAYLHQPKINQYATDRYPELPNPYQITPFPCPSVPPSALYGHYKAGY